MTSAIPGGFFYSCGKYLNEMNAGIVGKKCICHMVEKPVMHVCCFSFTGHSLLLHLSCFMVPFSCFFANQSYIVVKYIWKMMGYLRPWKRIDLKYVYSLLTDY